jgi:hypothetical protein
MTIGLAFARRFRKMADRPRISIRFISSAMHRVREAVGEAAIDGWGDQFLASLVTA